MAQSLESGERTYNQQCKACHTIEKGGPNTNGPNLVRRDRPQEAGNRGGFSVSSDAMKASAIIWMHASLGTISRTLRQGP